MSSETPKKYSPAVLIEGNKFGKTASQVQEALGGNASAAAALGAILEEHHDRTETLLDVGVQILGDGVSYIRNTSHENMVEVYNLVKSLTPKERIDINATDKLLEYPIMLDVGPGNVQIYTAINLLKEYNQRFTSSDPLNLKKYNTDYVKLAHDLSSPLNTATVKFASLMTEKGMVWGEKNVFNWGTLTYAQKEGFSIYYYNVGEDFITQKYNEKIAEGGVYTVDIDNTDIAQEYILNRPDILKTMSPDNPVLSDLRDKIANGVYDNDENCFPSGTNIHMADGSLKPIEEINIGDAVVSFNKAGEIVTGYVTKLFNNTSNCLLKLTIEGKNTPVYVTEGHHFLTEDGDFKAIGDIVHNSYATIITDKGDAIKAAVTRVMYSEENSSMFHAEDSRWKTYNFEVEHTHTYIAEGIRVHNLSEMYVSTGKDYENNIFLELLEELGLREEKESEYTIVKDGDKIIGVMVNEGSKAVVEDDEYFFTDIMDSVQKSYGHLLTLITQNTGEFLDGALNDPDVAQAIGNAFANQTEALVNGDFDGDLFLRDVTDFLVERKLGEKIVDIASKPLSEVQKKLSGVFEWMGFKNGNALAGSIGEAYAGIQMAANDNHKLQLTLCA